MHEQTTTQSVQCLYRPFLKTGEKLFLLCAKMLEQHLLPCVCNFSWENDMRFLLYLIIFKTMEAQLIILYYVYIMNQ